MMARYSVKLRFAPINLRICDKIWLVRAPTISHVRFKRPTELLSKADNTAIHVFDDENRIEIYDVEHSINEDRYNTIGLVHDLLFVVYTERKDNLRIISARLATMAERRLYYDCYGGI